MKKFQIFFCLIGLAFSSGAKAIGLLGGLQFTFYDYYTEVSRNQPSAMSLLKTDLALLGQFYPKGGSGFSVPLNAQFLGDRSYLTSGLNFDIGFSVFGGMASLGVGPGFEYNLTGTQSVKYIWSGFLGFEMDGILVKVGANTFAPLSETQRSISPFVGIFWRFQ